MSDHYKLSEVDIEKIHSFYDPSGKFHNEDEAEDDYMQHLPPDVDVETLYVEAETGDLFLGPDPKDNEKFHIYCWDGEKFPDLGDEDGNIEFPKYDPNSDSYEFPCGMVFLKGNYI